MVHCSFIYLLTYLLIRVHVHRPTRTRAYIPTHISTRNPGTLLLRQNVNSVWETTPFNCAATDSGLSLQHNYSLRRRRVCDFSFLLPDRPGVTVAKLDKMQNEWAFTGNNLYRASRSLVKFRSVIV